MINNFKSQRYSYLLFFFHFLPLSLWLLAIFGIFDKCQSTTVFWRHWRDWESTNQSKGPCCFCYCQSSITFQDSRFRRLCGSLPKTLVARGHRVIVDSHCPGHQRGSPVNNNFAGAMDLDCRIKISWIGGAKGLAFYHEHMKASMSIGLEFLAAAHL